MKAAPPTAALPGRELIPELEARRREYQDAAGEARGLYAGLTDDQLAWQPEPGRWSIAECLDHLNVTGEEILKYVNAAVERGWERGSTGSPPFRYGWLGDWFVRATGPSNARKMPAPRVYRPRPNLRVSGVLPGFIELQDQLTTALERANGLDLARVRSRSPVTPLLRIGVGQWFAVVAGHQVRHLQQARAVREHPGFPRT